MKKILSVLLCVMIIGAMFCVSASAANELAKSYDDAKDGELLYEVVFNAKDGVYVPGIINADNSKGMKDAAVKVSDDGKTVTVTHDPDLKGRFYWGGEIKGLEIGEGKSYTLTGKLRINGTNASLYFNSSNDYNLLYGFYGGQKNGDMTLIKGGKKLAGEKCDGSAYEKYAWQDTQAASADGYIDVMIIVEGYTYSVYFNGELFDTRKAPAEDYSEANNKFGLALYVFNTSSEVTAHDFKLYRGNKLNAPAETEAPVVTEAPATEAPTTDAPATDAPATDAPTTDAPATDAPTTEPTSPVTGDNTAVIILVVAVVAMLGTAVTVKAVREK